ncbi:class I SAM-dependent methyltransferase [Pseudoalteromonas ruthenica]|uniref:class I SAM-dependent methyltransferase n=1 Tax=Pseudoalteromonas ruthenica TaxID=151081 RepID=UPI00110B6DDD|nr:class I SAM-dependent methyltransferase [Pseudoalteromonas ruthenica]TMO48022.1 16S rRNA methyltransferase [Pseudoalteromonas ruthenica]TMO49755.1 16S rRNA methyltransferase [Pseudoalteromonas ruthenica]
MRIYCRIPQAQGYVDTLATRFQLAEYNDNDTFYLQYDEQGLSLVKRDEPKLAPIRVDFVSGGAAHRRKFGGGKGQAIAKAVGLNKGAIPHVLDATAGLGRDAFVLASLGCTVTLFERHPVVAALLADGLERAYMDSEIGPWMRERMRLEHGASQQLLPIVSSEQPVDVVYLDPMFPHREKSALVKKEMRVFQTLVGDDQDADALLAPALSLATKRVVVKRPDYAPFLEDKMPSTQIKTKKNRFDVYVNAAMR